MDYGLKKRWIAALKGGDYEQGQGYLNRNGKYCCLGVLCDISGKGHWKGNDSLNGYYYFTDEFEYSSIAMLDTIAYKFDIHNEDEVHLANLNDQNFSFDEIADWIEDNIEVN